MFRFLRARGPQRPEGKDRVMPEHPELISGMQTASAVCFCGEVKPKVPNSFVGLRTLSVRRQTSCRKF